MHTDTADVLYCLEQTPSLLPRYIVIIGVHLAVFYYVSSPQDRCTVSVCLTLALMFLPPIQILEADNGSET